jgi:hypothetical protein
MEDAMSMNQPKRSCAAALILATLLAVAPAAAQQPAPSAPEAPANRSGFDAQQCMRQAEQFAGDMLARIESALPAGTRLDDLKAAAAKARDILRDACASGAALASPQALAAAEKATEAMLQALRTMRSAFDTFYGSLSDEQKRQLDALGRQFGLSEWAERFSSYTRPGGAEAARRDFDAALRLLQSCLAGRCFGDPLDVEPQRLPERRWRDQESFGRLWRE